jgi:hypothetical protein
MKVIVVIAVSIMLLCIREATGLIACGGKSLLARAATRNSTPTLTRLFAASTFQGTTAELSICKEAASYFIKDIDAVQFSDTKGGVNNVVQYVETKDAGGKNKRLILRIYNNGFNSPRYDNDSVIYRCWCLPIVVRRRGFGVY